LAVQVIRRTKALEASEEDKRKAMHESPDERRIGGTAVHVRDCYVWAEIQYLDSPTDYREYLQTKYEPVFTDKELTFEDEKTCWQWEALYASIFIGFLFCLFLRLVSWY
jgi:hypothetical protein